MEAYRWVGADGTPRVTYFIDGLTPEQKGDVLAKLVRDGHMPPDAHLVQE